MSWVLAVVAVQSCVIIWLLRGAIVGLLHSYQKDHSDPERTVDVSKYRTSHTTQVIGLRPARSERRSGDDVHVWRVEEEDPPAPPNLVRPYLNFSSGVAVSTPEEPNVEPQPEPEQSPDPEPTDQQSPMVVDELGVWEPHKASVLQPVLFYATAAQRIASKRLTLHLNQMDLLDWAMRNAMVPTPA